MRAIVMPCGAPIGSGVQAMTERKPLEPVALPNCWADSDTAFYTANQIRSLVEEVRAEYTLPDPAMSTDHKLHDHAVRDGARAALDAILARLEK